MINNSKEKFEKLLKDYDKKFEGWDFKYLSKTGRVQEFPLRWNYYNEIKDYCINSKCMLDMGTGGGEFLSSLSFLPKKTYATERYGPNIKIARERLNTLGIKVYAPDDKYNLPIESDKFDLVINRHSSYVMSEVKRILKNKGYFITQQVGGFNCIDLNIMLGANNNKVVDWNLTKAINEVVEHNFRIIKVKEDEVKTRFYDIGAIVYYLKAIPWQVDKFSVEKYYHQLYILHNYLEEHDYIDFKCHRFFMITQK